MMMADPDARVPDEESSMGRLAQVMKALSERLHAGPDELSLDRVVRAALDVVPGASSASVTLFDRGRFRTLASTSPTADAADALQYELGTGPCVDAILDDGLSLVDDVATDPRWPVWGPRARAAYDIGSVLAFRLHLVRDQPVLAGLNLYSHDLHAFDQEDVWQGMLLASHCAMATAAFLAEDRADHLQRALDSSREIGIAVGVLMAAHRITRDQAFDLLTLASQDSNRKLVEIASEVVDTGELTLSRWPRTGQEG